MTRPHLLSFSGDVKKTAFAFRELHATSSPEALNQEWLLLENVGGNSVNVRGCQLTVAANAQRRPHPLGTLDPGFILQAGGKIRLVTGSPAKKSQGAPPDDDVPNYHLFLREPILTDEGLVLRLTLHQLDLARAVYAPGAKDGIGAA
jgi:hypothetical protein